MGKKITLLTTAAILASLAAVSVRVSADDTKGYTMYRVYNRNSGEHFYTKDKREQQELVNAGWHDEGTAWYAPESGAPVYRLYNKNAGDHHYTMSTKEKNELVQLGWSFEGIGWYSPDKGVALQRAYNPNAKAGSHNYTVSNEEQGMLLKAGWKNEGTAWYGLETKKPTFSGIKDSQFTAGQIFDDHQGIKAIDFLGHQLEYTVSGKIDPMKAGQYELTYQVTDEWKQTTTMKRKIIVKAVDVAQPEKPVLIKPMITGAKDVTIAQNTTFDLKDGVQATDSAGKPLPVIVVGTVDTKRAGEYYISYQASDQFGATQTVNRKVTVTASPTEEKLEQPEILTPPVITGVKDQTFVQRLDAFDPKEGIQAVDNAGKMVPITVIGGVDTKRPGDYYLAYQATDGMGITTTVNQKVTITEQAAPTITGTSDLSITQTMSGFDPLEGVRAVDAKGKTLDVKVEGEVDTKSWGPFSLTYIVSDDFGHQIKVNRIIEVRTIALPVIEGAKDITLTQSNDSYDLLKGIRAKDGLGNELKVELNSETVDFKTPGTYYVRYETKDMFGNRGDASISVTVQALASPVITGVEDLEMNQTSKEVDLLKGVEAKDSFGNKLDIKVDSNQFDARIPSDYYYISYSAIDSFGNQTYVSRNIKVKQLDAPIISGIDSVTLTQQQGAFDPMEGVSAVDGNGNKLEVIASRIDKIDLSQPNMYGINYEAVDEFGNTGYGYRSIDIQGLPAPTFSGVDNAVVDILENTFDFKKGVKAFDYNNEEIEFTVSGEVDFSKTGDNFINYEATDKDGRQTFFTRIVTVTSNPAKLIVLNGTEKLHSGETKKLTVNKENGDVVEVASWESLAPDVATIDNNGQINILKEGLAKIKVTTVDGITRTFNIAILDFIEAETTIENKVVSQNIVTSFDVRFTNKDTRVLTITELGFSSFGVYSGFKEDQLKQKGYQTTVQPGESIIIPYFDDKVLIADYLNVGIYVKTESNVEGYFSGN